MVLSRVLLSKFYEEVVQWITMRQSGFLIRELVSLFLHTNKAEVKCIDLENY